MSDQEPTPPASQAQVARSAKLSFGLFAIFFLFYLGAACLQTPMGADIASTRVMGFPFGMLMSLLIFPMSWLLIAIWFWKGR